MKGDQEQPRLRQSSTVGKDEVLRDSSGRVIDDEYVQRAVEDALSAVAEDRRENKA